MKTSLDELPKSLPPKKLEELNKVKEIIEYRFRLQKDDPRFSLEMIILFGSYARGTWIEESHIKNGITHEYNSDFDILIVTNKHISDKIWLDLCIEENIEQYRSIKTEVNIIHHAISTLNRKIEENHYFFTDITKEGILLYDSGQYTFSEPGTITPQEQGKIAQEELEYWMKEGDSFLKGFKFYLKEQDYRKAAFLLHQATQSYYTAILLVFLEYKPRGHNVKHFRRQANGIDIRFQEAFPNSTKEEEKRFELLKRAYIDARYKKDYTITAENLQYLYERVLVLRELTDKVCPEEVNRLKGMGD
jgi:HEPN domain-containing protein/predicted nucleotidyltransferase